MCLLFVFDAKPSGGLLFHLGPGLNFGGEPDANPGSEVVAGDAADVVGDLLGRELVAEDPNVELQPQLVVGDHQVPNQVPGT